MFTAGTLVLLASGKTVPISQLKTGDTVLASDTKSGKDQPETVTGVLVHHDTDLHLKNPGWPGCGRGRRIGPGRP